MTDERVECCDLWCQRQQTGQEDRDMILVAIQYSLVIVWYHTWLTECYIHTLKYAHVYSIIHQTHMGVLFSFEKSVVVSFLWVSHLQARPHRARMTCELQTCQRHVISCSSIHACMHGARQLPSDRSNRLHRCGCGYRVGPIPSGDG